MDVMGKWSRTGRESGNNTAVIRIFQMSVLYRITVAVPMVTRFWFANRIYWGSKIEQGDAGGDCDIVRVVVV